MSDASRRRGYEVLGNFNLTIGSLTERVPIERCQRSAAGRGTERRRWRRGRPPEAIGRVCGSQARMGNAKPRNPRHLTLLKAGESVRQPFLWTETGLMRLDGHNHCFMHSFCVKTLSGILFGPAFNAFVHPGYGARQWAAAGEWNAAASERYAQRGQGTRWTRSNSFGQLGPRMHELGETDQSSEGSLPGTVYAAMFEEISMLACRQIC